MSVTYREHVLANGLRIAAEVDDAAASAAAGFFVSSGARDDPPESMGISHFLEHMVFKGTESRSGEDIDAAFDDLGTGHNAWTSHDMTAYHVHGLPDVLDPSLRILADIMRPALRDGDLDVEREVILEEIAMYEDQPFWQLWEGTAETFYGDHPMGHRVLGTKDTVASISPDTMRAWHDQRYGADNIVLSLAGSVDFDRMVELAESLCGHWPERGATRVQRTLDITEQSVTMHSDRIGRAYILTVAPAPPIQSPDRHAAALLNWILGRPDGSRLHWALVDPGRAEEATSEYEGHDGCGHHVSWAICPPEDVGEVESTFRDEHERLVDSLKPMDLECACALTRTMVAVHSELPAGRMQRLGRMLTSIGVHTTLEEELARIEAVTLDDLRAVAHHWPVIPVVTGRLLPAAAATR